MSVGGGGGGDIGIVIILPPLCWPNSPAPNFYEFQGCLGPPLFPPPSVFSYLVVQYTVVLFFLDLTAIPPPLPKINLNIAIISRKKMKNNEKHGFTVHMSQNLFMVPIYFANEKAENTSDTSLVFVSCFLYTCACRSCIIL